jgi:prophage DNA circulation protein
VSWRDRLQPAAFRGVPFLVEEHGLGGGRRVVVHEYPEQDDPHTEDLGRRAREFTISAYLVGDDYDADRDRLWAALEKAGSAELVHPYLGRHRVQVRDFTFTERRDEGRVARFQIAFVQAGALALPKAQPDTAGQVAEAAATLRAAASSEFTSLWSVPGQPDFVVTSAIQSVTGQLGALSDAATSPQASLLDAATDLAVALGDLEASVADLVQSPADLAARFEAVMGLFTSLDVLRLLGAAAGTPDAPTQPTPTKQTAADNDVALARYRTRIALADGAVAATSASYEAAQDAQRVLDEFNTRMTAEVEAGQGADGDVYVALATLRAKLRVDLTERALELPALVRHTPPALTSSLELAWELYADTDRESELVGRNAVFHPGFITGTLEVLAT